MYEQSVKPVFYSGARSGGLINFIYQQNAQILKSKQAILSIKKRIYTLTSKTFVGKSFGGITSAEELSDRFFNFGGKTFCSAFQVKNYFERMLSTIIHQISFLRIRELVKKV